MTLWIAYDHRYGLEPSRGTAKFPDATNSSKRIICAVENLYRQITDRHTGIRRIEICANKVVPESYIQYDLFSDPYSQEKEKKSAESCAGGEKALWEKCDHAGSKPVRLLYI